MKKPKEPIRPYEPYKPRKPEEPAKEIEQTVVFHSMQLDNYDSYSFLEFAANMAGIVASHNKDASKVTIEISCEVEHGYYDDVTAKASINFGEKQMVPNPSYQYWKNNYAATMKCYEEDLALYKKAYEKYELQLAEYKAALPDWEAYQHAKQIEFHQKQLEKLKKAKNV